MYLAMRMGRPLCWPRSQKWPYFSYPHDQQLWQALEIVWGDDELDPPSLSQLSVIDPFPRPF